MSRRRLIRPSPDPTAPPRVDPRRLIKLRERLTIARRGFQRWLARLKRAGNAIAKQQTQIARLERQIKILEES